MFILGSIPCRWLITGTYGANGKLDMTWFHPIAFEPAHNGYHVPRERVGDAFGTVRP